MRAFDINAGAEVEADGRRFIITNAALGFDEVEARDASTGRIERLRIADLREPRDEAIGVVVSDLSSIDAGDFEQARVRAAAIEKLLALPHRTRAHAVECAKGLDVGVSTLYRWIEMYRNDNRISTLLPVRRDGGRGKGRLSDEVERIIQAAIDDHHLKDDEFSVRSTFKEVRRLCRGAKLKPPHENTVRARISAIPEKKKLRKRGHSKLAADRFEPRPGKFEDATHPLALVQIDHTRLDIILVDEEHRLPLQRPWLTLVFDVYSRMVLGFYISVDAPGAFGTGLAIARAIIPKEVFLARYDIKSQWPCWGFPNKIHLDNAREFKGEMVRRACDQYGIDIDFRQIAKPETGGHIERMMGTLAKQMHEFLGSTGKPAERGDYDPEARAVYTLPELERQLTIYITSIYHEEYHSGIKSSPLKRWNDHINGNGERAPAGQFPRPTDEERIYLDFMPIEERSIQTYGVQIDDVRYYHDVLRPYIRVARNGNKRYTFRRDPRDISVIHFWDPDLRQYSAIPYRNVSHPAISVWELRAIQKRLKEDGKKHINEDIIFEAYERLRQHQETAKAETKKVRRAHERRKALERERKVTATPQASPAPGPAPKLTLITTPKRFRHIEPLEIDDV